jgi:hypothetical protein
MEDVMGWSAGRIRDFFESQGFALREWDKVRTDSLTICPLPVTASEIAAEA